MLIKVFKSNHKLINILTVVLILILWIPAFFIDQELDFPQFFSTNIRWLDVLISIVIISGQSIYLNTIVWEYKLVKENSHLTSLMLLVLNAGCFLFLNLNQVVIANSFILIAFHQLLRMYNSKNTHAILFNSSFLIALASLIYLPNIVCFALLWITLIYTTTPKWRDFIISLIGLSIPIVYYLSYKFVFQNLGTLSISNYSYTIFDNQISWVSFYQKVFFIGLAIISLLAFISMIIILGKSMVRVRKMLVVVILMLLLNLGTIFLNKFDYLATFLMSSIPLAIILANFFQNIKKTWIGELLFFFLLIGIVLGYFS